MSLTKKLFGLPPLERFMRYVQRDPETGCHLWTGTLLCKDNPKQGYGVFSVGSRNNIRAHRWIYEQTHGPIPPGLCVMHACDTPRCVNVEHLRLGTNQDNTADRQQKGRAAKGFRNNPKLTLQQVSEIRAELARGADTRALAARYGMTYDAIQNIKSGRSWRGVC